MLRLLRRASSCRPHTNVGNPIRANMSSGTQTIDQIFASLDLKEEEHGVFDGTWAHGSGARLVSHNPATGDVLGHVQGGRLVDYMAVLAAMDKAKWKWAETPAPLRGEVVRTIGMALRENKDALGALISLEMGKILPEGLGEVQEAIDICDFAVGLSRSLNGSVIPSERPSHFMMERYNPLMGHVGIITAFNFPVAVYFWNLALSLVAGNTNLWKPAESTCLTAVACTKLVAKALEESGTSPAVACLVCGTGGDIGAHMAADKRMELISFTGSTATGRKVNVAVAARFGKTILELGGNNAMIIDKDADMELAVRACLFSAVGTAGQRCTTLRRLFLHESIHDDFVDRLKTAYSGVNIGDPLAPDTLCGPLHTRAAVDTFHKCIERVKEEGGSIVCGGTAKEGSGNFVVPTIACMPGQTPLVLEENFVPVLYVMKFKTLEEAIIANNASPQGLSSSLFTTNQKAIFGWTGPTGSDCGIVNVNIGPSGAEIGGAFGGEKETGGGRESGSDSWKQYMRRSTCTINYGDDLPMAQGIKFGETKPAS